MNMLKAFSAGARDFLIAISDLFNKLPKELRFAYFMGATALLTLLQEDLAKYAETTEDAYKAAIITWIVINTIQYIVIRLGELAKSNE